MKAKEKPRGPFHLVQRATIAPDQGEERAHDIVEVWLGLPDNPESELVLRMHKSFIPALIATLRNAE